MGRTCAWCGTLLRAVTGPSIATTSNALCQGCLDELQSALSANGLKPQDDRPSRSN